MAQFRRIRVVYIVKALKKTCFRKLRLITQEI